MPKLVLVATHCAGRKLLDESGDEGQLDFLFDEACEMGCECFVFSSDAPWLSEKINRNTSSITPNHVEIYRLNNAE